MCNPFGTIPDEAMQFDQRLHAERGIEGVHPPLPWLYEGFAPAWRAFLADNPDVRAIGYLGTLDGDPDFHQLTGLTLADDWIWRFWASTRDVLEAGFHGIGFDASSHVPDDSPTWAAMQLVRNLGHTVYVESRPTRPHLAGWPVISIYRHFHRTNPEKYADAKGHLRNDQLGRTMVLIANEGTADDRQRKVFETLRAGYDVAAAFSLDEALGWLRGP